MRERVRERSKAGSHRDTPASSTDCFGWFLASNCDAAGKKEGAHERRADEEEFAVIGDFGADRAKHWISFQSEKQIVRIP